MGWQGIEGHDAVVERFARSLARGRLASTFLFVGPAGIGKRMFALKLAQTLLCQARPAEAMDPCGVCPACVQVQAGTHPDLEQIAKPPGKSELPLELFIGPLERRMQEGLCYRMGLKPFMGGRRIAVIDDADDLNTQGANALLKTLEEPPPRSVMILIGTSADSQLPTIRSRAQIIRFQPLKPEVLAELLLAEGIAADRATAEHLARHSQGSLARARELADPAMWDFRRELLAALAQSRWDNVRLSGRVTAFVEEAGKEAAARRGRARQVIGFVSEFYQQLVRRLCGAGVEADADLARPLEQLCSRWPGDAETAAHCVSRSLEALEQVDRNAHQAMLLECWLDDLAQIASGRLVPAVTAQSY